MGDGDGAQEAARLHRQAQGVITGKSDLPLPLVPEPTHPGGPRPAGKARAESQASTSDDSATVPVPLVDADTLREGTPPPLPPSPAAGAAEVWLEDAVTRPSLGDPMANLSQSGTVTRVAARVDQDPIAALREAHAHTQRAFRKLLVLSIVTAFAVGLALGALLLRGWH